MAKLSKALQTERLDLSIISSLVDATLHSLEDAILPTSNWVLEHLDAKQDLETVTEVEITTADLSSFQDKVGKPFAGLLKDNISNRFSSSKDIVASFSIFDPKKVPVLCMDHHVETLIDHYAKDLPAKSVQGAEFAKKSYHH